MWTKDENPGLWDSSAAGHVDSGESYDSCAHRELKEELSIHGDLKIAGKLSASSKTAWEHVTVYTCVTDQLPVPNSSEILEGMFYTIRHIQSDLISFPDRFTSTFKIIISDILSKGKSFYFF